MTQSQPPFAPLGIDHIVLWVGDLEEARTWYTNVLGCRPGIDYPDIAMTHLWFGPVLIGLWDASDTRAAYARPKVDGGTNVDHIAFSVGEFDPEELRRHLGQHNLPIEKELRQTGSRGWGHAVYIRDPWGNRLELKGPAPFDAPEPI